MKGVDEVLDEWDRPAEGGEANRLLSTLRDQGINCPDNLLAELQQQGVSLSFDDLVWLTSAVWFAFLISEAHLSKKQLDRQLKIRRLAERLSVLLDDEPDDVIAVKGSEAGTKYFEFAAPVEDAKAMLDALALRSAEKEKAHFDASGWPMIPGSNSAEKRRFAYWLSLLAFWHCRLRREIKTSTNPETDTAGGPLLRFIRTMSGDMEPTPDEMRAFVRNHKDKALELEFLFHER
ncbi:MAG: hypothetical protein WC048_04265 [Rhizobium sp.]